MAGHRGAARHARRCQGQAAKALSETLADPEVRSKLVASGLEHAYESAAAVAARIDDELPRMRAIAQRANIRAE